MKSISQGLALAGIVVLGLILFAGPVLAEPAAWDQERVEKLANELNSQVVKIKDGIIHARETADPKSARWVVLDDLMQLQHRVVAFSVLVSAGQGRQETEPVFRRVRSAIEHARRDAPAFPAIQRQHRHIEAANAALEELSAFYAPK